MGKLSFKDDVLPLKDKLYRLALRVTLDTAEAEDAVQETLMRVWQRRDEWDAIASLEAYSLTVCRNLALDAAKRAGRGNVRLEDHTETASESPHERMDARERLAIVRRLMDSLPETQRAIMELRDIEGMSYREIAAALSLSETQVKVYLHRARAKIKEKTEEIERYGL